jgi:adenylate kinase family enzyme
MQITFIVGLPGSGKTTLGNQIVGDREDIVYLDDITVFGGINELKNAIEVGGWENIIVSDVFLCRPIDRSNAVRWLKKHAKGYDIEWIYFENAPDKCLANVLRRNADGDDRKVSQLIYELTKLYVIPDGVEVRKVYCGGVGAQMSL